MQQQFSKKITTPSIQEQSSSSSSRPIQYFMREVAPVSQEKFNKLVLNFVIQGLHPLSIVERAEFKELFKQVLPSRHVMSRKTLVRMLEDQYISMKTDMCKVLSEQEFVATTTDAWSKNHKSYLGVTVHWIDSDTLTISSGALACRRIKGRHTYDTLAEMLESVHMEFSIQNKVVLTTTDNGSNFVKAFSVFAAEEKVTEDDEENDEEADVEFTDVAAFLQETKKDDYHLPAHQRCACHSLHLVATKDAEAAVEDSSFKKISRAAFAKCQSLWNKQSRRTQASDNIKDRLGCMLVVPNVTRWNSTYNAMDRLKTCIEEKPQELHDVCEKMDIPRLKPSEITFIKEYVMVSFNCLRCIESIILCKYF